jgi:signal transduction histidine kinase
LIPAHPQFPRLAAGARIFGLVILSVPVLLSRDDTAALALVTIAIVWAGASTAEHFRLNSTVQSTVEAALVGVVCGLTVDAAPGVLVTLAVPPFAASLRQGPRGMGWALGSELITLGTSTAMIHGAMDAAEGAAAFTWLLTGTGLGLIGSYLHATAPNSADPVRAYRDAQKLIRELIGISGELTSGLDPVSLGSGIADKVHDRIPVTSLLVQVPRDEGFTPLVTEHATDDVAETLRELAVVTRNTARPALSGHTFAFPLLTEAGVVALVAGAVSPRLEHESLHLLQLIEELAGRLEPDAVQLDTALLFASFRDSATADERRRLAREMHDGVAQDVASLGYMVDGIAAGASTPEQAQELRALRSRITAVVAEVRRSVQTLRTEHRSEDSLGASISALAQRLGESSGVHIQITADEGPARLRPEVESELFRIAQEAMNNAVRHANATRIDVRCTVDAPGAELQVEDDGSGLGTGRPDSWGLEMMRERARLIGAELGIEDTAPHGTLVWLRLGEPRSSNLRSIRDEKVKA